MITAVDTSVLLDVFTADAVFGVRSKQVVRSCILEGSLIACDVVWAEVGCAFPTTDGARQAMERLGVACSPVCLEAAWAASVAWRMYRSRGGRRDRVIADFLIGAHARTQAERLVTRDRGFYRKYFEDMPIVDPSSDHP